MNIWIEPGALQGPDDRVLRGGTLYGLLQLQKLGHQCGFEPGSLTETQRRLIDNEPLDMQDAPSAAGKADYIVSVSEDEGILLLKTGDNSRVQEAGNWLELVSLVCFPRRTAEVHRQTAETDISVAVNLDGTGETGITTGLGFLDHMLEQIGRHGLVDLRIKADGDLEVDEHHTIEDTAITLGTAVNKALGDKTGIRRYGFVLPMDESQARVALDLSGRPYLEFNGRFDREKVGDFPTEMVEHFFYSLAIHMNATLHITVEGDNDHHKIEACFKGFARSLRGAVTRDERHPDILPSTKNKL